MRILRNLRNTAHVVQIPFFVGRILIPVHIEIFKHVLLMNSAFVVRQPPKTFGNIRKLREMPFILSMGGDILPLFRVFGGCRYFTCGQKKVMRIRDKSYFRMFNIA